MKYRVYGTLPVSVSTVVEVSEGLMEEDAEEDACEKAQEQFEGVQSLVGHGGNNKMIGVKNQKDTLTPCEGDGPEFDYCERID